MITTTTPPTPQRVTFYVRDTEQTLTTDPRRVAAAFLESPMSRKLREAAAHPSPTTRTFVLRHIDGPLSRYLRLHGATCASTGSPDPHRTRHSYETVYGLVRALLLDNNPQPRDTFFPERK